MGLQLLIMGAPNAGKGTLCEEIRKVYGLVHLSTGDLLREEVRRGTALGQEVKAIMQSGQLVPDATMVQLIMAHIHSPAIAAKGLLLDGFPRTRAQADALLRAGLRIDGAIVMDIDEEKLLERCAGRRIDPVTGQSYHVKFNPPPEGIAKRLIVRADDTPDRLKKRLSIYNTEKGPLLATFRQSLITIDAGQSIDNVFAQFHKRMGLLEARMRRVDASTQTEITGTKAKL